MNLECELFRDEETASEWAQENEARLQKVVGGDYQTHDWRQVMQEIRRDLKPDAKT